MLKIAIRSMIITTAALAAISLAACSKPKPVANDTAASAPAPVADNTMTGNETGEGSQGNDNPHQNPAPSPDENHNPHQNPKH